MSNMSAEQIAKIEAKRKPSGAVLVFRHQLEPAAPPPQRTQPNRAALLALVGKRA